MSAIAAASPARPNALWQALSRNRLSWVGIGLLLLIVLAAVLAPRAWTWPTWLQAVSTPSGNRVCPSGTWPLAPC